MDPRDDRFSDTILDFVFLAGTAQGWPSTSAVIVRDGDFPDTRRTSDHRPVEASLSPLALVGSPLREKIDSMRERLLALEELLDQLRHDLDEMEAQIPPPP